MENLNKIYGRLAQLEKLRKKHKVFVSYADAWTIETYDTSVLAMGRYFDNEKIIGIFNFSEIDKTAWISEQDGMYVDLVTGQKMPAKDIAVPAYGFYWLQKVQYTDD